MKYVKIKVECVDRWSQQIEIANLLFSFFYKYNKRHVQIKSLGRAQIEQLVLNVGNAQKQVTLYVWCMH